MSKKSTSKPVAPKATFTDANANSFSDKILRWELLQTKLEPLLDSMPHVKPVYVELVQLIANAKEHEFELKGTRATAQQGAIDRKAMIRTGDAIRSRLASALAFEHGPTSVHLKEFGIRPRKGRGNRTAPQDPAPPPAPPPVEVVEVQAADPKKE